ncbi:MAG: aspartyl-tRNA(Asn)/glutamyl-tRNA(Gln) amidotransferase subunit [Actinomycetota bacterium]|jgi:aspartyl-tRNA(Asn)/glutamyl-tRNA(Gln) amidotransferase subunit A|nr:aspartyl-tRNA(Asn)/glutamyl-tRNA(Gln) amidotransferase subunit [Actinomycetota bacterium]
MTDAPWLQDACSLVDAFRAKELSPTEALDACLAAIESSALNAFCHVDADAARDAAAQADVSLPFGGVPLGVKELEHVRGWPSTEASVALRDEVATFDSTNIGRLRSAGFVLAGQTTASEFGGVNLTFTKLHGSTRNPWQSDRTPGGSSGGSASAVAGGLVPIATGGDGGGSIRIPAGFTGLFGLKCTYGRFPKGPYAEIGSLTAVLGCMARSVRDAARWVDVANGFDHRDPYSLPRVEGYEAGLGTMDLRGRKAVIAPNLGGAVVHPEVEEVVVEAAEALAKDTGLELIDVPVKLPESSVEWALAGLVGVKAALGDRYPACEADLTPQISFGLRLATELFNLEQAANGEVWRHVMNEAMAELFDQVDFVFASTNPDVAFSHKGPLPSKVGDVEAGMGNNGALTIPSNIFGSPAVSIPAGLVDGLPVGLQVLGRHHAEPLLLDLALVAERERPWPLVAPNSPL